jgi:hypothetical protein
MEDAKELNMQYRDGQIIVYNYKNYDTVSFVIEDDEDVAVIHDDDVVDTLTHRETYDLIYQEAMRLSEFTDKLNV